jgi:opacity protein-like surface antigen
MKTHLVSRGTFTLCAVTGLGVCGAHGQEPYYDSRPAPYYYYTESPFYIKADVGGTWTEDTDLEEFFGVNTAGVRVRFDPGYRLGLRLGMLVTDWFAAEAETGVMGSEIDSLTAPSSVDARLSNIPFMLNARFQPPNRTRLTPYVGGGLGVSGAILDVGHMDLGFAHLHGTQSDAVFAYQAFAGVRYALNDRMGLSAEYRYFGTTEPEWRADVVFGGFNDRVRFGGIQTQAFSLAFDYRF